MSENKESFGQIQIADEVIAVIAATAVLEVEGVMNASSGAYGNAVMEFFGKKIPAKGVKVEICEGDVTLDVEIIVLFGTRVQITALEVQKKVKIAVETMTGLNVIAVNVGVSGIVKEKLSKPSKNELDEE